MTFLEMVNPHSERHRGEHAGWLRAAVLGANDGLVSTASLMVGVAASGAAAGAVLTAGLAGLAAGSMAMAAGEYVSVSSQVDVERGDRAKEEHELATDPDAELAALASTSTATADCPQNWPRKSPPCCMRMIRSPLICATNSATPKSPPPAPHKPRWPRPQVSSSVACCRCSV